MVRVVPAICLVLLLSHHAAATSGEYVDVTCPVCANAFEGWTAHSTNTFGGSDRDFCMQARGDQVFLLACWTCPRCAYTGMEEDFETGSVPRALVDRLKESNPLKPVRPLDPETKRTTDIPAWVRWDLRAQVLDLQEEADAERQAWARLRAAHTQRFGIRLPTALGPRFDALWSAYAERVHAQVEGRDDYGRTMAFARALETDAGNADLPLTEAERRLRLLVAARAYMTRGESPDAARALAALRRGEAELAEGVRTLAEDLEARIAREREFVARALPLYQAVAAEEERPADERLAIRYLVGELHRKLGQHDAALAVLAPLSEEMLPEGLRTWVEEALARTKAAAAE